MEPYPFYELFFYETFVEGNTFVVAWIAVMSSTLTCSTALKAASTSTSPVMLNCTTIHTFLTILTTPIFLIIFIALKKDTLQYLTFATLPSMHYIVHCILHLQTFLLHYILYLTLQFTLHLTLLYFFILHIHACFGTLPDTKIVKLLSNDTREKITGCVERRQWRASTYHCGFLVCCSLWQLIVQWIRCNSIWQWHETNTEENS